MGHPFEEFTRLPILLSTCAIALIFAPAFNASAQTVGAQTTSVPPDVKQFAVQYVAASNAKDVARILSLNLPEVRACITPENKDVYDAVFSMQMRDPIPPNYLLSFMPVNETNLKALATVSHFSVKPERELHIDWQYPETNDARSLVLYLVRQNGRWIGDFPCMTADGIKSFRDNASAREHYKAIAAAIKEPLRSQLLTMLRAHQRGEASDRYHKATGSDMRTSMLVINALEDQLH